MTVSHLGIFIHISSKQEFLFLFSGSHCVRRTIDIWSESIASSFIQIASGKFTAQHELIRTQSNLSSTFSYPLLLVDQVKAWPMAPHSSIRISSIIELNKIIKRCDFILPSFVSWWELMSFKSLRHIHLFECPCPKFRIEFQRRCVHNQLSFDSPQEFLYLSLLFHHRAKPSDIPCGST